MTTCNYIQIADAIQSLEHIQGNADATDFQNRKIKAVMDSAPSGSGFDSTQFDAASRPNKLVFATSFHAMDENGYYDGWYDCTVTITPTFGGIDVEVDSDDCDDCDDSDDLLDYVGDVFNSWLYDDIAF